jgi:hypothetical protein
MAGAMSCTGWGWTTRGSRSVSARSAKIGRELDSADRAMDPQACPKRSRQCADGAPPSSRQKHPRKSTSRDLVGGQRQGDSGSRPQPVHILGPDIPFAARWQAARCMTVSGFTITTRAGRGHQPEMMGPGLDRWMVGREEHGQRERINGLRGDSPGPRPLTPVRTCRLANSAVWPVMRRSALVAGLLHPCVAALMPPERVCLPLVCLQRASG